MSGKIFINYRRGDDPGHTGRLFDRLQDEFPAQQLFLDVDNIAPGLDFVRVLNERVAECDIVLAVIGKSWIDARDPTGARRLDDPDDFVRIEITSALNQGKRVIPVLVGGAEMPHPEELPEALRPLARRNAVRLTHERFRADTQGLVKALRQSLEEIDALRRSEAEAARRAQVEEQRRRKQADAARRVKEEELRKKAAKEAREYAAEDRRRQQAAAKQRAEEEREYAAAKRINTVAAIDTFLAAHPESRLADEAQKLKAALLARAEAHGRAMVSDDPAVLRAFRDAYKKGADVDQVRRRLRHFEPRQPLKPAMIIAGALALVLVGAVVVWVEVRPSSDSRQVSVATTPPVAPAGQPTSGAPSEQKIADTTPTVAPSAAILPAPASAAAPGPSPDEAAWSLLRDTTDVAALKRFIVQYPDSPLGKDAEARIATLTSQAAMSATPSSEQIAWDLVRDSKDPDQLRRFVEQFPNSAQRADAEQRIASLSAEGLKAAIANAPDPHELTRSLQLELQRVGCFKGNVNGLFDDDTKAAWHRFIKLTSISMPDNVSSDAINAVRGINKRVCPLECPSGQHAAGELCIANLKPAPPPPQPKHAAARTAPASESASPAAAPKGNGKCLSFLNNKGHYRQVCE